MIQIPEIPVGSILGLNYSGMHDSAIAIIDPSGAILFAISLERVSRVKQDGRPPYELIKNIPWNRIAKIAVSTENKFLYPEFYSSNLLYEKLPTPRIDGLKHEQDFYEFLDLLPCEKEFVCHQMAHAASAFWGSGFDESLCLTYDGGMSNSPWFGGLYVADRTNGIREIDLFSSLHYAKITTLYTFVTALLGFEPNKHEGKLTGLAAFGSPTEQCKALLQKWFKEEYFEIESVMEWYFNYHDIKTPVLVTNTHKLKPFLKAASSFSRETLAATVQDLAEHHVLEILNKARTLGWAGKNICIAGGLFANVKINQKIAESGFEQLFVAPPMTDDGTALGAAWHVLSAKPGFNPPPMHSVYLGPTYKSDAIETMLNTEGVRFTKSVSAAIDVAHYLSTGAIVAVFQGAMEFGPRALGNRTILAQATKNDINKSLNSRLKRTEFMPFAPVSRIEDANYCYKNTECIIRALEFMTVTTSCSEEMKKTCPAVVHVDGTARPQLVSEKSNPFIHKVLSEYIALTNNYSLVNTSFNIHEEPIVCSPYDALQGFFESGLDYLVFNGEYLISIENNKAIAFDFLSKKLMQPSPKIQALQSVNDELSRIVDQSEKDLFHKEELIHILNSENIRKEREIDYLDETLRSYIQLFQVPIFGPVCIRILRLIKRIWIIFKPRLGNLNQYKPRSLKAPKVIHTKNIESPPVISIVTPSFEQGVYIEETLQSVLSQSYPNLEYFVQDGGSCDGTVSILRQYEAQLSGWFSGSDAGQTQAINRGFAKTKGEIMGWLNSDDLLLPYALHRVAEYFNDHPDVDVVYGNRLLIDDTSKEIGRWIMPGHDSKVLSWVDYIPQETLFWRRRIWEKVGGRLDESFHFAMDWDLLIRFKNAGAKFGHIPQFIGAFRVHKLQKTSSMINQEGVSEMGRIRERELGWRPDSKKVHRATAWFLLRHIFVDLVYRIKSRSGGIR